MSDIVTILHTARVETRGGRENGISRSPDGILDIRLAPPGSARIGTNPEQLLAAAWSTSLESAIALAACRQKITVPANLAVNAEVDLCQADGAFFLQARLYVRLSGLERHVAHALLDEAQVTCPYFKTAYGTVEAMTGTTDELLAAALKG